LIVGAIPPLANVLRGVSPLRRGIAALIVVGLACGWLFSKQTDFTGLVYRFGETNWTKYSSKRKGIPFIIWRDPPSETRDIPPEASQDRQT
jgi:hypothetical protein